MGIEKLFLYSHLREWKANENSKLIGGEKPTYFELWKKWWSYVIKIRLERIFLNFSQDDNNRVHIAYRRGYFILYFNFLKSLLPTL